MHPVMSELGIYLAEHEGAVRREAVRRERLVREAANHGDGRGMVARFMHTVRQFLDPRGYAIAELRTHDAARPPVEVPLVAAASASLAPLEALECAMDAREPLKAA